MMVEHDPEKWKSVFRKASARRFARRSCSNKKINVSEQAALDQALASAMPVTMTMAVESMRCTAEAAICRGATLNEASIRVARSIWNASGTAIDTRHKTHRYRADRCGAHHGQDDTAGTFHAITCTHTFDGIQARTLKSLAFEARH
jgi:hypothetical protein